MKKLLFSFLLLMTALVAVASPAYASSTSNAIFELYNGKIYATLDQPQLSQFVRIDNVSTIRAMLQDTSPQGSAHWDLTDYAGYDPANAYELHVILGSNEYVELNDLNIFIEDDYVDSAREFLIILLLGFENDGAFTFTKAMDEYLTDYDNNTLSANVSGYGTLDKAGVDMFWTMTLLAQYNASISTLTPPVEAGQDNWALDFYVYDDAGNYSYLHVIVLVTDVFAPSVADDSVTVSYAVTFDLDNYQVNSLSFTDNYDSNGDMTTAIYSNEYTASKTIPGSYEVVYSAEDTSGNVGYGILTLTVIDDVDPLFSGPTTLSKPSFEALTLTEIKAQLSANDAIDGNLTSSIAVVTDEFTGHGNTVGSYDIQFSVTDSSSNVAYHTITVQVYDNLPPVFYVRDGYFISVSEIVALSLEDIRDILIVTGQLKSDGTGGVELSAIYDEYAGNENIPGVYALTLGGTSISGNEYIFNLAIEVTEDEGDPDVVAEDNPWYIDLYNEHTQVIHIAGGVVVSIIAVVSLVIYFKHRK